MVEERMIRLFCTDFDNTLARRGKIPQSSKRQIQALQEEGIEFAIVSGRMAHNVECIMQRNGLKGYVVAANGGCVLGPDGTVLNPQSIDAQTIHEILSICAKHHWYPLLYDREICYLSKSHFSWWQRWFIIPIVARILDAKVHYFDWTDKGDCPYFNSDARVFKVNVIPKKKEHAQALQRFEKMEQIYCTNSSERQVELMRQGVNKWTGICQLAEALGISTDEIACIGDYCNDLPMLEQAHLSFAVENAHERVKQAVDMVVPSVRQAGINQAIARVIEYHRGEQNEEKNAG